MKKSFHDELTEYITDALLDPNVNLEEFKKRAELYVKLYPRNEILEKYKEKLQWLL